MPRKDIVGIVFGFLLVALWIAAMVVVLGTALAFGGILRWVCLAVILASVVALFGGLRGGFLHHDTEVLNFTFAALVIAAVVIPLAAKGAPLAILWLIPGGSLVVNCALSLPEIVLGHRRSHGAAAKTDMPVAKGSSIAKEEVAGIAWLILLFAGAMVAVVVLVAAWVAPRGGWWVNPFSIVAVVILILPTVVGKILPSAPESASQREAPVTPSPRYGRLPPPIQPGPESLREKNGIAILQVGGTTFEFDGAHLLESHLAALLEDGRKLIIINLS